MRLSLPTAGRAAGCALLVASACADPTAAPTRASARPSASVARTTRVVHPNSVKYRDRGFHPATGRSGSATVSTRALLGRSGTTDVEVTTGTFDDASPAAGRLASVQVKAFGRDGALAFTSNHPALGGGGSASFPYTSLPRGTALQVQTIVRGVDGTRSDVVTLTDAVHFRPDLVAVRLGGPGRASVGQPVSFEGFVAERLGDLGARASCVLYADGAEVDRADGIWVDAGGNVDCALSHRFMDAGTHALELRVEGVSPGDFDDSNNRVATSIEVVRPQFTGYGIAASDEDDDFWFRAVEPLPAADGSLEWWDLEVTEKGHTQFGVISGTIDSRLEFPVRVSGEMATNGATLDAVDRGVSGVHVDWLQATCGYEFGERGGGTVSVCVYDGGYLAGQTTVQYDLWGADVRYHSKEWVTTWDADGSLAHSYVEGDYTQQSPMFPFGSDFTARMSAWGANDVVPATVSATIPLTPFAYDFPYVSDQPCAPAPATSSCFEAHWIASGIQGYAYFYPAPVP